MALGEELKDGAEAVTRIADRERYPAVVSLLAIGGVCVLMFWQRQDAREDRALFLQALGNNTHAIEQLTLELRSDRRAR